MSPNGIRLASGGRVEAEHVVVSIGSGARGGVGTLDGAAGLRRRLRELSGARVLIRGAGHTGTEVAAEIAATRPDLMLTLSDPAGLLPDLSPRASAKARPFLSDHRVRVTSDVVPDLDRGHNVVIDCTGFAVPHLAGVSQPDATLRTADGLSICGDAAPTGLRMSCAAAEPLGAHVADNILRLARGKAPTPFSLGFVNHAVSLGRRDAVLQLVYADDRPRPVVLAGRPGAVAKELISRMARRVTLRSARHYRWPAARSGAKGLIAEC